MGEKNEVYMAMHRRNRELAFTKLASILFSHYKIDDVYIMYDYMRRKYPKQIDRKSKKNNDGPEQKQKPKK